MEKKTKISLFLNVLLLASGVSLFAAGIYFQFALIGIVGFAGLVYGGVGTIENTVKGFKQNIEFKKLWVQRKHSKSKIQEPILEDLDIITQQTEITTKNNNNQAMVETKNNNNQSLCNTHTDDLSM